MKNVITYVGIDAHKKNLFIAMLVGTGNTPVGWQVRCGDCAGVGGISVGGATGGSCASAEIAACGNCATMEKANRCAAFPTVAWIKPSEKTARFYPQFPQGPAAGNKQKLPEMLLRTWRTTNEDAIR
jgi:hypothetical protein